MFVCVYLYYKVYYTHPIHCGYIYLFVLPTP